jgi:hypothetical protein
MPYNLFSDDTLLVTKIQKSNDEFIKKRSLRIKEAISFKSGTYARPYKTIIAKLLNNKEVYFLKPGKETLRAKPNVHDMYPNVGKNKIVETDKFNFEIIWEYLVKISIINQITFKKVLVLLYRLCYFTDHKEIQKSRLRYSPSKEIADYIGKIDYSIKERFRDKFKKDGIGIWEFLHFVDILGWNEDVKYHINNRKPDFSDSGRRNVGRVNTILSVISVPLMVDDFLSKIDDIKYVLKINNMLFNYKKLKFVDSRKNYIMSDKELTTHLSPFLLQ